jgi:hypothetical protein
MSGNKETANSFGQHSEQKAGDNLELQVSGEKESHFERAWQRLLVVNQFLDERWQLSPHQLAKVKFYSAEEYADLYAYSYEEIGHDPESARRLADYSLRTNPRATIFRTLNIIAIPESNEREKQEDEQGGNYVLRYLSHELGHDLVRELSGATLSEVAQVMSLTEESTSVLLHDRVGSSIRCFMAYIKERLAQDGTNILAKIRARYPEAEHGLTLLVAQQLAIEPQQFLTSLDISDQEYAEFVKNLVSESSYHFMGLFAHPESPLLIREGIQGVIQQSMDEALAETYTAYVFFTEFIQGLDTKPDSFTEALELYKRSPQFKWCLEKDDITFLPTLQAAEAFGGFEQLLEVLVDVLDPNVAIYVQKLSDQQTTALEHLFEVHQLYNVMRDVFVKLDQDLAYAERIFASFLSTTQPEYYEILMSRVDAPHFKVTDLWELPGTTEEEARKIVAEDLHIPVEYFTDPEHWLEVRTRLIIWAAWDTMKYLSLTNIDVVMEFAIEEEFVPKMTGSETILPSRPVTTQTSAHLTRELITHTFWKNIYASTNDQIRRCSQIIKEQLRIKEQVRNT